MSSRGGSSGFISHRLLGNDAAAGYRSLTDRRWLWPSVPAGAFAIGAGLRTVVYISLFAQGHIGYVAL